MTLLEQIEAIWTEDSGLLADKWAAKLIANKDKVEDAVTKFREWAPLHVYLSFTRATKANISFSLRYCGQEVASLVINKDVTLNISAKTAANNKKYFKQDLQGTFCWNSKDAVKFRKYFKSLTPKEFTVRVTEHRIESEFLKQMSCNDSSKFNGTLKYIQPVLFAGCPFQFPLPISGNTGVPISKKGNIDILARRGLGGGTNISVWELKKPNTKAHSIEQAYIYAVSLIKMLRAKSGDVWYRDIIGFGGIVPKKLTIECVLAVSIQNEKSRSSFISKVKQFTEENRLNIGNDTLKFFVAHYQEDPLRVALEEI